MLYGYTFYHIYYVCAYIKMTKLYIFFYNFQDKWHLVYYNIHNSREIVAISEMMVPFFIKK